MSGAAVSGHDSRRLSEPTAARACRALSKAPVSKAVGLAEPCRLERSSCGFSRPRISLWTSNGEVEGPAEAPGRTPVEQSSPGVS